MDLPGSTASYHGWVTSWLVPLFASALLAARWFVRRIEVAGPYPAQARVRFERRTSLALVVAALVAAANYADYGRARYGTYVNEWDTFHYYLNTRYLPELGYRGLYAATLVADAETGLRYRGTEVRDLDTYDLVPVERVLARAPAVRARFSPKRWVTFVADVKWFKHQLTVERWSIILVDRGYNGTPPWTAAVGLATNALSFRSDAQRAALVALDPLLLLAMLACVRWAYGRDAAALVAVLVGTHYLLSWGHLKGSILRTDFAVCTVAAACCMRRKRYALAGALLGWAAVARAFPLVFAAGPAVLFASRLATERKIDRDIARFFAALAAVMCAAVLLSMARYGGAHVLREWYAKIALHARETSDWNVGFRALVDVNFVDGVPHAFPAARMLHEEPEVQALRGALLGGVRLAVVVPALYFARYLRDHEALTFGFVYLFFLASPDYYYLLVLCAPMLFYLERPDGPQRSLGAAYMLLTGAFGYLLFAGWHRFAGAVPMLRGHHQEFATTYYLTWAVCLTALHMLALAAARGYAISKLPAHMRR
jgi:hypothetical protein